MKRLIIFLMVIFIGIMLTACYDHSTPKPSALYMVKSIQGPVTVKGKNLHFQISKTTGIFKQLTEQYYLFELYKKTPTFKMYKDSNFSWRSTGTYSYKILTKNKLRAKLLLTFKKGQLAGKKVIMKLWYESPILGVFEMLLPGRSEKINATGIFTVKIPKEDE